MELENATSEGLAQSDALPAEEAKEDEAYAEIFRRATAGEPGRAPEPDEQAEPPAPRAEPQPEPAPSELPTAVREQWANIPKAARDAFLTSQREMSRKLSDMGRQVQGLSPIRDSLAAAAKEIPHLMNMRPEQVASEVMELAKISQLFNENPVETLIGLARKHGIERQLRAAVAGQPQQETQHIKSLQTEISALKQQLGRVTDPNYLREQVTQVTQQERVGSEVMAFSQKAEHWAEVEALIPTLIPAIQAKLGEGASAKDVLEHTYELALQLYLPEKAKAKVAEQAADVPDPRSEQALKAKSVNVKGTITGKDRELSEDERLAMIYRRASQK